MTDNTALFCYNRAKSHYSESHYAAALGYFLRTLELVDDLVLEYKTNLYCSLCMSNQPFRKQNAFSFLLKAISIMPNRPEAYYLYAKALSTESKWQECYNTLMTASSLCDFSPAPMTEFGYVGEYAILFERAIAASHTGNHAECVNTLSHLHFNVEMDETYSSLVMNSMLDRNISPYRHVRYNSSQYQKLRWPFAGSEKIDTNFSQSYQDMFVLAALNGKRNGRYLEIGSAEPFHGNNTALLEREFDWTGYSLEIMENLAKDFSENRKNPVIQADATSFDYLYLLDRVSDSTDWDYLQVDCDPPSATFEILKRIPFDKYRFATITYEHDFYADPAGDYRQKSREFLTERGYVLVAGNISPDMKRPYEDWWVHPALVDETLISRMKNDSQAVLNAETYMLLP